MSIRSMSETRPRTRSVTFSIQPSLAPFVSQVYSCHFFSFTVNRIRRPYGTGILADEKGLDHPVGPWAGLRGRLGKQIGPQSRGYARSARPEALPVCRLAGRSG